MSISVVLKLRNMHHHHMFPRFCSTPVLQVPGHRIHRGPRLGGHVAGDHRVHHCGRGGQLPGALHLPLHPGDLLHPHLPHLHLRDLQQTLQGLVTSSSFIHTTKALANCIGYQAAMITQVFDSLCASQMQSLTVSSSGHGRSSKPTL